VHKATLASVLVKVSAGIRFNEHMEGDGPAVFAYACKLGLEGIVSKGRTQFTEEMQLTYRYRIKNSLNAQARAVNFVWNYYRLGSPGLQVRE
jgi:ATP-dependent DNA ligase